ncbi:D-alanyl-D-alanine carboxypeptidase family protein [Antarcticirhabdus aurantiaca]|uniref:D-alanyl-D-alanine carboxypeptidase n=1 Tax=Antarcticirhabdus aurantiaca TaxID=2606717 RepID=A0ACD4NSQ1_9HYPH|nr:D-alanyl-D-alanine carboxypeptidase family protein [Antarcticirhabdus aurantiaca]WAJ29995.1 D-alanyl-D-alanine carboxypeptidase [Jeongeuplla avenae]
MRTASTVSARAWLTGLALLVLFLRPAAAFETAAPHAMMVDFETGIVLFEKDADARVPPASLLKLMTIAVIFNELKKGTVSLDDVYTVSEHAWRTGGAASGGSTMFLPLNSQVALGDLIKGIVIQSGNDATIVAAEGIAGSVEAFAGMMNARAAEIGLTGSHFVNPHGLPAEGQVVTMRDLTTLAAHIIRDYPVHYHLFSEEAFTFNGITQRSRNPLLGLGADGLKTGHTSEAGFGLVASAKNAERRIVFAMSGMTSQNQRAEEARAMMAFGLEGFSEVTVQRSGESVGYAPVTDGTASQVALATKNDVRLLGPREGAGGYTKIVVGARTLPAPVSPGTPAGTLRIMRAGLTVHEEPLFTTEAVEEDSFIRRFWSNITGG